MTNPERLSLRGKLKLRCEHKCQSSTESKESGEISPCLSQYSLCTVSIVVVCIRFHAVVLHSDRQSSCGCFGSRPSSRVKKKHITFFVLDTGGRSMELSREGKHQKLVFTKTRSTFMFFKSGVVGPQDALCIIPFLCVEKREEKREDRGVTPVTARARFCYEGMT